METTKEAYVGELIRKEIKDQKLTNGYVIRKIQEAGIEISDAKFSNKIYGIRDTFSKEEIAIANLALGKDFK